MGKADRTKALLQQHALALFLERGFDGVTVAQIAAAAGVTPMTFFRHFGSKEAVVLDDPYDPVIADLVRAQDRTLPAVERVRLGLLAGWQDLPEPAGAATRDRIGLAAGHPGLRAAMWENNHRTEDVIVDALIADGVGRVEARVAAGCVLGGLTAVLLDWASASPSLDREPLGQAVRTALGIMGR